MSDEENHLSDLLVDGLLKEFLDQCRGGDRDMAHAALDELRRRIYYGAPLPHDPRQTPEEKASARERIAETERQRVEIKRLLVASVALAQCRDALAYVLTCLPEDPPNRVYVKMDAAIKAADAVLK